MGRAMERMGWLLMPLLLAGLTSCDAGRAALGMQRVTVYETQATQPIQVAATAKVGEPVTVGLLGGGGSTCFQADRVDVQVDDVARVVTLKAFVKEVLYPKHVCGAMIIDIPLSATFTPRSVGVYRIEARGWDNAESREVPRTAEITVSE